MNLIMWDIHSDPPDLADLQEWAAGMDLKYPVLADPDGDTGRWYGIGTTTYTSGVLIDRGMVIEQVGDATVEDAIALVE
jgi:AhpC/TSA family